MNWDRLTKSFESVTKIARDIGWWVGMITAVSATGFFFLKTQTQIAALLVLVGVGSIYATIRAFVYRRRNKRILKGHRYVHQLMQELTGLYTRELGKPPCRDGTSHISSTCQKRLNADALTAILDAAAHCFRETTGRPCTASLIMPCYSEHDGYYLKSVLYSSDTDSNRRKGVKPQKGGLTKEAMASNVPLYFSDYKRELTMEKFVIHRPDIFQWARSGFMSSFSVCGEKWGILNIDSPEKNAFHESHGELVAAFSEACALICTLDEWRNNLLPDRDITIGNQKKTGVGSGAA